MRSTATRELIPRHPSTSRPSAELRPGQKDQDSLPPYDVLDASSSGSSSGTGESAEIAAEGFDAALVRRVIGMVERAEYKRRQAPPVLKVSPRAFGLGRRIPVARSFS